MKTHRYLRTRLSAMMFLEFLLLGAWIVPIGGYMNSTLAFTGSQIGWIYATQAFGAILSPLCVGYFADRLFPSKILGMLHLAGALCLFLAAEQTRFPGLMIVLALYMFCYMPTIALVNSLAFRHIRDSNRFSRIAVWGSIGWIAAGLIVGLLLGDGTTWFFHLAGGGSVVLGVYSFTLPHTSPKGKKDTGGNVLGLLAAGWFRNRPFLAFVISIVSITVAVCYYSTWTNAFLVELRAPKPTALMTVAQASEIVLMLTMPWFIARMGLKNVLVIGMAAWALRYVLFASMSFPLIIAGLLLHGFCYCFINVAAFIYGERIAPPGMSARVQSFVAFLIYGVGTFAGSRFAGFTGGHYGPGAGAGLHDWPPIWIWPAALSAAVCLFFLVAGREPSKAAQEGES